MPYLVHDVIFIPKKSKLMNWIMEMNLVNLENVFLKLPIIGYPWCFNVFVNMLARMAFVSCHTDSVKLNTGQYQDTGFAIVKSIHTNNILWTYPANRQPLGTERCILFIFEFLTLTSSESHKLRRFQWIVIRWDRYDR